MPHLRSLSCFSLERSLPSISIFIFQYLKYAPKSIPILDPKILTTLKVDQNMARAQQRDASASKKFFFKKDVYSTSRSATSSATSSSGASTPPDGSAPRKKDKKMKNCFPPPPLPENGLAYHGPVEDEYEEMTMKEIMNGKVRSG